MPGSLNGDAGVPKEQIHAAWDGLQGGARGEYAGVARSFAASLGAFAGQLRRVPGPKLLLIFSQGVDNQLYFDGDSGIKVGTTEATLVDTRRMAPLLNHFREPMAVLADSGAMPMFVNTDRSGGKGDPGAVLGHLAKSSGGLLFEGRDPAEIEARLEGSTSAYYEAGFRPAGAMATASRAPVEVIVRRPGVRAWAPSSLRMWEPYRELSLEEKRQMAIDLVAGGPEAQGAHTAVRLKFQSLGGKMMGQVASGAAAAQVRAELAGRSGRSQAGPLQRDAVATREGEEGPDPRLRAAGGDGGGGTGKPGGDPGR